MLTNFKRRNEYFFTLLSFDTSKYCIFTRCKLKLQWSSYHHWGTNSRRLSAVKVGLLSQVHVNSCS